jgi:hypothetical protein
MPLDIPFAVEGVVESQGQGVAAATVILRLEDKSPPVEHEQTTNAEGKFRFDFLASRTPIPISIEIRKGGFSAARIADTWNARDAAEEGVMWPAKKRYVVQLPPASR